MLYLHDVWVNWFEGEENGYCVGYFHEWRKSDRIELLDQVPLLYINTDLYHYLENDMHDLPKALLATIYKRAFIRKAQERIALDYACVVTDGNDIMALDTIGYQIPIRKSRLIPRQEQLVYDMIRGTKKNLYKLPIKMYKKEYNILSMKPQYVYGLTRRERQLKQVLMMSLDQLRTANNIEELRYWLTEWNPKQYDSLRQMDADKVWHALYDGLIEGWSKSHEELGAKMIKGQPFLEKVWELEQNHEEDTSKLKK